MGDVEGSSTPSEDTNTHPAETQAAEPALPLLGNLFQRWRPGTDAPEQPPAEERRNGADGGPVGMSNLRHMRVQDVAVPVAEIAACDVESTKDDLIALFRDSGFTRLPVYEGTLDSPLGMVHLKDMALKYGFNGHGEAFDLRDLVRPVLYVPPSMPIGVLLTKMQSQRLHMALVIDEYGGTDGLVTIEDLIEQVIGEIEDEHDVDEDDPWRQEGTGCFVALARASLSEFEMAFGRRLTMPDFEEDVDTLGGLVFLLTGRVPARGEIVPHPAAGVEFEVLDADPRRIKRLRVRPLPNGADPN